MVRFLLFGKIEALHTSNINILRCINYKYIILPTFLILLLIISSEISLAQEDSTAKRPFWGKIQGPPTNEVHVMTIDSTGTIFAGTWGSGISISRNNGSTWNYSNNGLDNLYITAIEFDSSGTLYAGTWGGGIFRSVNGGNNWTSVNSGLTSSFIKSIKIKSGGLIFAGTYGKGVFRSTDGGNNWTTVGKSFWYNDVNCLVIANNGSIIAGTSGGGIFRSSDNGNTWGRANSGIRNRTITSFAKNNIGEIYAGTLGGGVHFSVDNGASWSLYVASSTPKKVTSLVVYTNDQPIAGTCDSGIYRYDNIYESWRQSYFRSGGINSLAKNRQGLLFAGIPKEGILKSTNGGVNWTPVTFSDETGIYALTAFRNGIIVGTSKNGGVYRTTDYGTNWSLSSLGGTQINYFAFDSTGNLYSAQNNGLHRSTDFGTTWSLFWSGDPNCVSVEVNPSGIIFAGAQNLFRTTDGGNNWTKINSTLPKNSGGIKVLAINNNGYIFVVADTGLVRSTDNGNSWSILIGKDDMFLISMITFNSSGHVFMATDKGMYRSINNGQTWTINDFGWEAPQVSHIAITHRNYIYAGMKWERGVLFSSNNGNSWDTVGLGINYSNIRSFIAFEKYIYLATTSLHRAIEAPDLGIPVLKSPSHMSTGVELNPVLVWDSVPKADLYQIQVSTDLDFGTIWEDAVVAGKQWKMQNALNFNSIYNWRVRAKTNSSLGEWSAAYLFTSKIAPPVLVSPLNDTGGLPNTVKLVWNVVDGAASYQVQVSLDSSFSVLLHNKEIKDTTYTISNLSLNTTYYWRVQGKIQGSTSDWSEIWHFRTKLKAVKLRSPANGFYGVPLSTRLEWAPVEGAVGYRLQISKFKDFSQLLFEGETETDSLEIFDNQEYFTTYYWKISAYDNWGNSDWSEAWSYITVIQPAIPVLPKDSSYNNPVSVDLVWEKDDRATAYHIQAANDPLFNNIAFSDTTLTGTIQEFSPLDNFSTYYWRVRIKIDKYWGLWSKTMMFTTELAKPSLTYPSMDAIDIPTVFDFRWNGLKGADKYRIEVAKNPGFTEIVTEKDSIKILQFHVAGLDFNTTYYWHIMGFNEYGTSSWSDTWIFRTKDPNSVDDINTFKDLIISPNPFSNTLNINFIAASGFDYKILITDVFGKEVKIFSGIGSDSQNRITWQPENLSPGIYFVKLTIGDQTITQPVVFVK